MVINQYAVLHHGHLMVWARLPQLLIMLTPIRGIFHCEQQNGYEWAFAVLTGAGSLLVSLATKLFSRCACHALMYMQALSNR